MKKNNLLEKLNNSNNIKKFSYKELDVLSQEIRAFLIDKVSKKGGHLSSNLGVVELTIALHRVLDLPKDKIIYDVGHQSYVHKILSGRKDKFDTLREFEGLSGFPKREESEYDAFNTGHSSTSISAALGMAKARDLSGKDNTIVAFIGDGSMTGGLAFEALNNAVSMKKNFLIVLNDNNMSIDKNIGGLSKYFNSIRSTTSYLDLKHGLEKTLIKFPCGKKLIKKLQKTKDSLKQLVIPGMLFENMGIRYLGPIDGHDIKSIEITLKKAKKFDGPVIIHALTKKGKGYEPSENNPTKFHGIDPFDVDTGEIIEKKEESFTSVFAKALTTLGNDNKKIVAITAAMPDGTGLSLFKKKHPSRFFDVGIAEEHAVTFASGLSSFGYIPVISVYSSFLQRAFDQIVHDVAIQNMHVVFAIDRAGIVGKDGETHQGILDISYLNIIPNMTIMAPKNKMELIDMLSFACSYKGPISIRYPRGEANVEFEEYRHPIVFAKSEYIFHEEEIALLAFGSMVSTANKVREKIKELGIGCSLINLRFAKPLDEEMLREVAKEHSLVVILEEGILKGGVGESIESFYNDEEIYVHTLKIGIDDSFVVAGNCDILKKEYGLDSDSIFAKVFTQYRR